MVTLPYYYGYDFYHPRRYIRNGRLAEQDLGLTISPYQVYHQSHHQSGRAATPMVWEDYGPWKNHAAGDVGCTVKVSSGQFQAIMDMQHFAPEEISVKTVADGYVVVEAKHEEKQDEHGYVSRQLVRRYELPESAAPEGVQSELSSDGVLTITAPMPSFGFKGERKVAIVQTGPVRQYLKDKNQTSGTKDKK